jgi:aryl-alcohol dehydrogenase-like predicted oxidoreductase
MADDETWPARMVAGHAVHPIGMGAMELTFPHTRTGAVLEPVDHDQALGALHAALDAGIRLIDTAINYTTDPDDMGRNERLVGEALATWSGDADDVLVVAKGGNRRVPGELFVTDGTPANLRWSCETSLRELGVEAIGLYLLHTPDPAVPLVESVGALAELRDEGKIRAVGVSNCGRRQLAEARTVVEIAAVENQLSPFERAALALARSCADDGVAFLAWSPLGGQVGDLGLRERHPVLARIADDRRVSPHRVALAWCLAQAPNIVPIPSAVRPAFVRDNAEAASLRLTPDELAAIDAFV